MVVKKNIQEIGGLESKVSTLWDRIKNILKCKDYVVNIKKKENPLICWNLSAELLLLFAVAFSSESAGA